MRVGLIYKYLICYIFIVMASLLIFNTIGVKRIENGMVGVRIASMKTEAEAIRKSYIENYYAGYMSGQDISSRLKTIAGFSSARILIVKPNGKVILDTKSLIGRKRKKKRLPMWLLKNDVYMGPKAKQVFGEDGVTVIYPIDIELLLKGYVVLVTPMSEIKGDADYHIDTLNVCFLLLSVIFLFVLLFLYRISIVPLRAVIKASKEYASGHLDYKFPLVRKGQDEFNDLVEAIQFMASEMSKTEEYQRKFIANISHDFRSPLTSIKGYAEAMMDGTIPPELVNKYLGTICFETDRLTKLTSGLIELGKFDSKAALLEIKVFDMNAVIKKTAEVFEGRCREKRISLNLIFENEKENVKADEGKIQQVLYNLLDNAIKFSNQNAEIRVGTREKGNKVFVSVKDFGAGIPKEAMKKIWDRFYKSDASRGKDKKGSGLGLSIVKEIIQSHGEEINVISTENAGTEFVFTLNKAGE